MYTQELQSGVLPLLIPTPNGKEAAGHNREKWILNPGATSSTHMDMFAFFGKLMGIAIRSKQYLALNIPSIIWKLIVGDLPTLEDLEGIDFSLVKVSIFKCFKCNSKTEVSNRHTHTHTHTHTQIHRLFNKSAP